jgi:hypothetical protein
MKTGKRYLVTATLVGITIVALTGCGSSSSSSSTTAPAVQKLIGTFKLTAGAYGPSGATGTYFRMINPGGTIAKGPFFSNPDSTATDKSYTLLSPGTDGGLTTGKYQPNPSPAFDSKGNSLAKAIVAPAAFEALDFGLSTNPKDPQSGTAVPAPSIDVDNGTITGTIPAWSATWNNLDFNQGSPKPDGSSPGLTRPVSGTYDPSTHAFVITWASQVVGGPFNGFTGYWHLQGSFAASS